LIDEIGRRISVHGHRGARAIYPENTIPAFLYAIEAGADALEMDLAVTKDNLLVVSHDPLINPEICRGPYPGTSIYTLTLAELRAHDCGVLKNPQFPKQQTVPGTYIPTLKEVLDLANRGSFQFDIEIKSFPDRPELTPAPEVFAGLLLEEIRRRHLEQRVVVLSFDFRVLQGMQRLAPEMRLAALWEGDARPFDLIARDAEADIVSPEFKLVTAEQVSVAHAHSLDVVPWTANTTEDWQPLIDAGVDGIITDDPAALIGYLKANGLR
jgi:glycerophosphoryl diester phosphodiesterase